MSKKECDDALDIEGAAVALSLKPATVRRLVKEGLLKTTRKDGMISQRALLVFIHRQQRVTRRYLRLRSDGLDAKKAWAKANAQERPS